MSFKRLDPEDISISAESIVQPAWSSQAVALTNIFQSSGQVASNTGNFYIDVFDKTVSDTTSRVQFSIAYGHKNGLGSVPYNSQVPSKSPSSTIYGQYRNLVFGDEEVDFTFGGQTSNDIYVISIERARYKEKLFPGTFNIALSSGSLANTIHLTDNSNDITTVSYVDAGRVYDIISGSNGSKGTLASGNNAAGGTYGKFLPDVGLIILSGTALNATIGAAGGIDIKTQLTQDASQQKNTDKFFDVLKNAMALTTAPTDKAYFKLQSEETISSNFVFVRVRNGEFNYSTNPSNITSSGELRHNVMINTPQAYITTIGMYNDDNDLLGVAKLSRPLLKDFTKEALVRIKLDY
jgi:hypothetical protein